MFFALLLLPAIFAINVDVEKISENEVYIPETGSPAVFDLKITNLGGADSFEFYNLLSFKMFPIGTTPIATGETKDVQLKVSPIGEFNHKGTYTFEYYIRSQDSSEIKRPLSFKIVDFENAFEIGSGEFYPDSNTMEIYIKNNVNFNFENLKVKFNSPFFKIEEDTSLSPYETKQFSVQLNKEDFKKLMAGYYTLNAEIVSGKAEANIEGVIKFVEKNIVTSTKKDYGFVVNTMVIQKKNEGNIVAKSETVIKKNIVSRIFTSFSPEPDIVERNGAVIYYTWQSEINPGETFDLVVKTNWLMPLLIIFFIIVIIVLAKQYTKTDLVMKKRVSFVKSKGGEFALKVTVSVQSKKYVERINIIDRLPPLVKLYEKFAGERPTKIDEHGRKLEWTFSRLSPGESRTMSYILYSKVGVLGKFALPSATAIYEREGNLHEAESNRAFFVADQIRKEVEEWGNNWVGYTRLSARRNNKRW